MSDLIDSDGYRASVGIDPHAAPKGKVCSCGSPYRRRGWQIPPNGDLVAASSSRMLCIASCTKRWGCLARGVELDRAHR